MSKEGFKDLLDSMPGTSTFYRHRYNGELTYTTGVKLLAEGARGYWLIDKVADLYSNYNTQATLASADFDRLGHRWMLTVKPDRSATLCASLDADQSKIIEQEYHFTEFELDEIVFLSYRINEQWKLMLPSELQFPDIFNTPPRQRPPPPVRYIPPSI